MKVVLCGAFGNLGKDILKELINKKYQVVACDMVEKSIDGIKKSDYAFRKIDVCNKESLQSICDGADIVITTVGLTGSSTKVTHYDIDLNGNVNILNEAIKAGVKHFTYISVIKADSDSSIPMLDAKAQFEKKLVSSGMNYVIHRPTGYFYDIAKVFKPMIEKGKVTLLGRKSVYANVIATEDFAEFIVEHMKDNNKKYNVGGKETYSYSEIAQMFFESANKKPCIKHVSPILFTLLAKIAKRKKNGKEAIIKFSKWTLTHEMVGDTYYGKHSFKEYIKHSFEDK